MTTRQRRKAPHQVGIGPVEHELTIHLERAHDLGERAARSNGAVQLEIARALAIAEELTSQVAGGVEDDNRIAFSRSSARRRR